MNAEKLADLIEKNPNCVIDIDNDCWFINAPKKMKTTMMMKKL